MADFPAERSRVPGAGAAEPVAALSPAEQRFDRQRRTVGLFLGPVVFALCWWWPLPALSGPSHQLAAITALVVVWWVTEALPLGVTALVGSALAVVCGVATPQEAFQPYASPTIFLFIGSFMLGQAIAQHRLDSRVAATVLDSRWVRASAARARIALGLVTMAASAWMSNAATVAMMLPLITGLMTTVLRTGGAAARPYVVGCLITIAYASGLGGLMTPVGTPPNLITLGLLDRLGGVHLTFPLWMALMVPIAAAQAVVLFVAGAWWFRAPGDPCAIGRWFPEEGATMRGGSARGQRNAALAFAVAVTLWLVPGGVALVAGADSASYRLVTARLNEGVVAVLAAGLLFILPTDWGARRFTLEWAQAVRIDWGTILLFGGGLSLGDLLFRTGLAEQMGRSVLALTGSGTLWTATAAAMAAGMLLTELTSNTACASMLVPVVLSTATAAGLNPTPPALGALLGVTASYMLPISAPHNAIIYGSGMLPVTAMVKFGLVMKGAAFVISLAGLRVLCPLLGLA